MPVFSYKARNHSGTSVSGVLEAISEVDLLKKLQALNYIPIQVSLNRPRSENVFFLSILPQRVKSQDIVMLNMKLAYMTNAGIPLLSCMRILAGQIEHPYLKDILLNVSQKVFEGAPLSKAVAGHPKVFSDMYVSMIRVGEVSGTLHLVLNRMAVYIEQEESLKQKVRGALFYPLILLCAGSLVGVLIVTFVIPQFIPIFTKANVPLPLPTIILYQAGIFLKKFGMILIPFIFGAGFLMKESLKIAQVKNYLDRAVLHLPHIGRLMREVFVTRFCRVLGILIESGVPILECLDVIKDVIGNNVYKEIIVQISQSVQKGEKISYPLKGSGYFPNDVTSMIATGEETGKLAPMLEKVADFYEAVVDQSVKKLTTLIEPFFIVIMGLFVGVIMASMLLPMFDMVKTIQQ